LSLFDERPHAFIDNEMIHFVAYTALETPSVLQWAGQSPKIAPSHRGILTPI